MQIKPWRVTWYDAAGEIESADFVDEHEARREMNRVKEDRLRHSVKLWRMRQTDEAAAAGLVDDDWELIEE